MYELEPGFELASSRLCTLEAVQSWVLCHGPVIPATQEAKTGRSQHVQLSETLAEIQN